MEAYYLEFDFTEEKGAPFSSNLHVLEQTEIKLLHHQVKSDLVVTVFLCLVVVPREVPLEFYAVWVLNPSYDIQLSVLVVPVELNHLNCYFSLGLDL